MEQETYPNGPPRRAPHYNSNCPEKDSRCCSSGHFSPGNPPRRPLRPGRPAWHVLCILAVRARPNMKTPNPTGPQALMGMDRKITKKPGPSRKLVLFASGGAFVLVLAYLFFFQFRGSSLNVEKDRVTVSTVEKGPFLEYIPITGAVMPISRNSRTECWVGFVFSSPDTPM